MTQRIHLVQDQHGAPVGVVCEDARDSFTAVQRWRKGRNPASRQMVERFSDLASAKNAILLAPPIAP